MILVSADPPERSRRFREKLGLPFPVLADERHEVADRYEVPIARKHPKAWGYADGFIQPAVLAWRGEEEVFRYVAVPRFMNLWGAAGRPTPEQVLDALRPQLAGRPPAATAEGP